MNSSKIDITGIDKVELLRKLWTGSKPALFFNGFNALSNNLSPPTFDNIAARVAVRKYIDYFQGCCIKLDISGVSVDPHSYDKDAGFGAFEKIVDSFNCG